VAEVDPVPTAPVLTITELKAPLPPAPPLILKIFADAVAPPALPATFPG
jgi:hypothetical protein